VTGGTEDERFAWAVLASADGVGPATFMRLIRRHVTASAVVAMARQSDGAERLVGAGLLYDDPGEAESDAPARRERRLLRAVADAIVEAARRAPGLRRQIDEHGLSIMTLDDADYPPRLLEIDDPPPVLFVRGDRTTLAVTDAIAVVGTRHPTGAGRRVAFDIGVGIARLGGVVVSGLAVGIDGRAHEGAVAARAPTIAVIGSGHGVLYPVAHKELAHRIVETGGAVVSELPPMVRGTRGTFPQRNRIISGLARATVVVEAPSGSGALITADRALEQGREVFVVPGPLDSRTHAGSLHYIRGYHGQVRTVASIPLLLEDLGFAVDVQPAARPRPLTIGATEARIAERIVAGDATVDALAAATQLPVPSILAALTLLEMRGLVAAAYGRYRPAGPLIDRIEARTVPANL
jgi:DNA processing protein